MSILQSCYEYLMFANQRIWVPTPLAIDFPKQRIRHEVSTLIIFFLKGFSMDVYYVVIQESIKIEEIDKHMRLRVWVANPNSPC